MSNPVNEIAVIGFPSRFGGADTELDHQIRIWTKMGIKVHIIHTGVIDHNLRSMNMHERGCVVHTPRDWEKCKGLHTISYCNGEFLKNLEVIKKYAKTTTFVNCMTWLFSVEKEAHQKGLIDCFLYQTDHAREKVQDELKQINSNYNWCKVDPYFYKEDFPFVHNRPTDKFRFGRISRDDPGKYNQRQVWVYETMVAPVLKHGIMLGFSEKIRKKFGYVPEYIDTYAPNGINAQQLYRHSQCIIQMTDTYENLPRVGFEAMASGSVLIVDNRGGWKELIKHGETGFLCDDDRAFVYYSSRMAFEPKERDQIAQNAREHLENHWGEDRAVTEWTKYFEMVEKL